MFSYEIGYQSETGSDITVALTPSCCGSHVALPNRFQVQNSAYLFKAPPLFQSAAPSLSGSV